MKRLLLILIPFLLYSCGNYQASRGPANWIYVSQTGDDGTGDGSSGNPFATVSHAATTASSGDTIYVQSGTIVETAQIVKPLGVSIYGGGVTSIISSSYAGAYTGSINCASSEGNPVDDNGTISNIKLTGNSYSGRMGIYIAYRNNITIHDCTIEDFTYGAIKVKSNNADAFTAPTVNYATGISIHDNTINDCGYNTSSYASVWFDGTSGISIYNNTFHDEGRAEGSNSWATLKCNFNKLVSIYDNIFYRDDHADGDYNFFMENWNYKGDCQLYNNKFIGLATIDLGGPYSEVVSGCTYGYKIYDNKFINGANGARTHTGGNQTIIAINLEGNQNYVYVYRNIIQRYGWAIELSTPELPWLTYTDDWMQQNIYIYYNIISDVGYTDYAYCYGILLLNETNDPGYDCATDNLNILNNVITGMTGSTYQGIRISAADTVSDLNIKNNIVRYFDSYAMYFDEHATDGLSMTDVAATYNCMNGNGTNSVGIEGTISQSNVDVSTGNITSDPLFRTGKYRLQSGSPCKNTGTNVSLTSDYAGHDVPQNTTPDMGAFEYGDYLVQLPSGNLLRNANGKLMYIH